MTISRKKSTTIQAQDGGGSYSQEMKHHVDGTHPSRGGGSSDFRASEMSNTKTQVQKSRVGLQDAVFMEQKDAETRSHRSQVCAGQWETKQCPPGRTE